MSWLRDLLLLLATSLSWGTICCLLPVRHGALLAFLGGCVNGAFIAMRRVKREASP